MRRDKSWPKCHSPAKGGRSLAAAETLPTASPLTTSGKMRRHFASAPAMHREAMACLSCRSATLKERNQGNCLFGNFSRTSTGMPPCPRDDVVVFRQRCGQEWHEYECPTARQECVWGKCSASRCVVGARFGTELTSGTGTACSGVVPRHSKQEKQTRV